MPPSVPRDRPDSTHGWLWRTRVPGTSFFVPTLNPHAIMAEGLRTSSDVLGVSRQARARMCIYKGLLGVMFTVR